MTLYNPDKRVIIVDVTHIAYTHSRSRNQLNFYKDGQSINTTIQSGIIKNLWNWTKRGQFPAVVCFDRPAPHRKAFLSQHLGADYKSGRSAAVPALIQALNSTGRVLTDAGVPALAIPGFEADDIVGAAVSSAKVQFPDYCIDVITGDADLLPLVDDQVSVWLRSVKSTSAVHQGYSKNRYEQVTPSTFREIVESKGAFKSLYIPYNYVLLAKLLRGDTSDGLKSPVKKFFRPNQFNDLVTFATLELQPLRYHLESAEELFAFLNRHLTNGAEEFIPQLQALWAGYCLNYPYPSFDAMAPRQVIQDFTIPNFDPSTLQYLAHQEFGINLK